MKKTSHKFSLLEVVIVIVLVAFVMSIVVFSFRKRSPGVVKIELKDTLTEIFSSAAIRSQAFGIHVKLTFTYSLEEPLRCRLENEETNPELPTISTEDETEEQYFERLASKRNQRTWGGVDEYTLPAEAQLLMIEELVDDNNEIIFRFFPDGEAVGPDLKFQVGEFEYLVRVDRLKGQMMLTEAEKL